MLFDEDRFCRSVLLPVAFGPENVFDADKCLTPTKTEIVVPPPHSHLSSIRYGLSLASRALLSTVENAHAYGCHGAAEANARLASANGGVVPSDRRRYYLGFYDLLYRDIRTLDSTYYTINLKWKPEGSDAHFQLDFVEKPDAAHLPIDSTAKQRQKARQQDRLAAVASLSARLLGPMRHICECDVDHTDRLLAVELPVRNGQPA